MRRTGFVLLIALLVAALGCQQTGPKEGVVVTPTGPQITQAPEVTFKTNDGKEWKLSDLFADLSIVSFATLEGSGCVRMSVPIWNEAKRLKGEGIPVIEVAWPTGECDIASCSLASHEADYLYTCLADPDGKARKAFGLGEKDMAFLVGSGGKIMKSVPTDDIAALVDEAMQMQHDKTFTYKNFVY